jgi:twinkle protein
VKELDVILNSVYRNYASDFGTAQFSEDDRLINKVTRESIEEQLESLDGPLEDVIYLNDIFPEMLKDFHSGSQKGETTHFPGIDERFRWSRGEITIVGGIGNFGKSTMMLQLMLMKSLKDGYRWAVFSPEQYPPKFFYNQLIHALVGKSPYRHHRNQMSEDEYRAAAEKIKDKFYFIYPEKDMPTQDYINRKFVEAMVKHNVDGCMVDPFNAIYRDRSTRLRDDQFLEDFFRVQKRFALENNVYMVIVAHPNSSIQKDERTGDYKCPRVYDFAGGAMWNNKADNIIMFHRPYYNSNPNDTTSIFVSQKIKKKELNGTTGECVLTYDVSTGRFYDDGYNPLEADKHEYTVNSKAMVQSRMPYGDDDDVPY